MTGYNVKVTNSSREHAAREGVSAKDTTNAMPLIEATKTGELVIDIDYFVELAVHNEKSPDKDYKKYVVVSKDGNKYVTGSESFFTAFKEIFDEMNESDEDYSIAVYRVPSKN